MKELLTRSWLPLVVSSIIFIIFQLRIYNLGLGFRDEGFLFLNASRILSGEIPYRDFFMTTTPGSFYLAALIIKIFGFYIIEGRIIYMIFVLLILLLVNGIFKFEIGKKFVVLAALAIIFIGNGAIGYYNLEALTFALSSFYFLNKGLDSGVRKYILVSGFLIGVTFIFKQSFGIWAGLGFCVIILFERFKKYGLKDSAIVFFIFGGLAAVIPFIIYFYINNALSDLLYYFGTFSREVKSHRNPFIFKSLISLPLIYYGSKFLRTKLFYKHFLKHGVVLSVLLAAFFGIFADKIIGYFELSRIYYAVFLLFPVYIFASVKNTKENLLIYRSSIFLLVLFLAVASSGRELGALIWVSPIYLPLIMLFFEHVNSKQKMFNKKLVFLLCYFLIFVQVFNFASNNLNPLGVTNDGMKKNLQKYEVNLSRTKFLRTSLNTKKEIEYLTAKLKKYKSTKKLLCFPYCPLMNVLVEMKSPSYYNFFYPEAFLTKNQDEVINNLKNNETVVVLQKKGDIDREALYEDVKFAKLKNYILKNYSKLFETANFAVYSNQ